MPRVCPGERISLIDIGYGYGDVLRAIRLWSRHRGFVLDLIGLDLNPLSEPIARAATPRSSRLTKRSSRG